MTSRSRGAIRPRFAQKFHAQESEGAGNAGCALHPRSRVQNGRRKRTRAYRFSGGTPTFPAQWFYGLLRDLPGDQDLFVTVAPRMMAGLTPGRAGFASAGLDANHEASGPHDFAVRSHPASPIGFAGHGAVRQRAVNRSRTRKPALQPRHTPDAAASTASRPASLTIRIRPSVGRDGEGYVGDLGVGSRGISENQKLIQTTALSANSRAGALCAALDERTPGCAWLTVQAIVEEKNYRAFGVNLTALDKKSLSEIDICDLFISPAIRGAGWDPTSQIRREVTLTPGPVVVRGNVASRNKKKKKFADYVLYREPGVPIAVIEAKDTRNT